MNEMGQVGIYEIGIDSLGNLCTKIVLSRCSLVIPRI